jgi:hypothetical protein
LVFLLYSIIWKASPSWKLKEMWNSPHMFHLFQALCCLKSEISDSKLPLHESKYNISYNTSRVGTLSQYTLLKNYISTYYLIFL